MNEGIVSHVRENTISIIEARVENYKLATTDKEREENDDDLQNLLKLISPRDDKRLIILYAEYNRLKKEKPLTLH